MTHLVQKIRFPIMIDNRVDAMYEEVLGSIHISDIYEETTEEGTLSDIRPCKPESVLNNWTAEETL